MNLSLRKNRKPARHTAGGVAHRELSPARAAAFAGRLHGRPDPDDGMDIADALAALPDEPRTWTHAVPVHPAPGAQDPAMQAHAGQYPYLPAPEVAHEPLLEETQPWTRPEDMQAERTRRYVPAAPPLPLPPPSRSLAIPLDREVQLTVKVAIASGRYEDVDAYASRAQTRAEHRFDRVQSRLRRRLADAWAACTAIAAEVA